MLQEIDSENLEGYDSYYEKCLIERKHMFIITALYRVSEEALLNSKTAKVFLDRENLLELDAGCFICERVWSKDIAGTRCKGEPDG